VTTVLSEPSVALRSNSVRRPVSNTRHLALLAGLLLLSAALRIPNLTLVPQFTDESLEVLWSLPIARGESLPLTNYDAYYGALFNYLVAASFGLLGPSALAARLVVLVAGLLTVLATYALARAWGGRSVGLLAAALLALNVPHVVINSHVAWANCTTPLFTTLAALTLYLSLNPPCREDLTPPRGKGELVHAGSNTTPPSLSGKGAGGLGPALPLSGLLWGLALQTHPAVATLLPGAAVYVLWRGRRLLAGPWPYLAVLAFLLGYGNMIVHNLTSGPESLITAQRIQQDYATDQDAAGSYPAALGAELLLLGRLLGSVVDNRATPWEFVLDLPLLLGVGLGLAGLIRLARQGNPLPLLLVVSCLLLLPALNPKFRTLISSRYLMPLAPILFAAIAVELNHFMKGPGWQQALVRSRPYALALGAAFVLLITPLPRLAGYYERLYATGETNERVYAISRQLADLRQPDETLVVDEAFGSETGGGISELRALRYLLAFDAVPIRVLKITPKRLEDELQGDASLLVILNGRQVEEFQRLPLEPLTEVPRRGREIGIFRLAAQVS
jgi:glycosyltransferase AglD